MTEQTFESREKMAAICILGMLTCDVTLPCIACRIHNRPISVKYSSDGRIKIKI